MSLTVGLNGFAKGSASHLATLDQKLARAAEAENEPLVGTA
jgi:hypothetical protein